VKLKTAILCCLLGLGSLSLLNAQKLNPIKWDLSVEPSTVAPGGVVHAKLTGKLEPGWHLYSLSTPKGGPIPTTIGLAPNPAIEQVRIFQPKPFRKFDPNFQLDTETYEGEPVFILEARIASGAASGPVDITSQMRYQLCDDRQCLPPKKATATATLTIDPAAKAAAPSIPAGYTEYIASQATAPVTESKPTSPAPPQQQQQGIGGFLLVAFGLGLAAIFTPCVFPMIPITLSFFLNKEGVTRAESLRQAAIFCIGIVVLFSAMGLGIAAILGPFGVNRLGSNPFVSAFIAAVFFIFGLSLLGAFEITIPSSLLTRMDRASQSGGVGGTLLMGLTFSLTSFACIGPFVGTLLAASVESGGLRPILGMVAFATGLASPFFLLALFPSYLKRLPRSGGWLARVKVVMGFVVLAAMLKYLSNIDVALQWNVLTRERFLAAWFVLFALAGLYLLGFLRLEGVRADDTLGIGRMLVGALFLIFAFSLIPGMFGGQLGELDGFVPPSTNPVFGGTSKAGTRLEWRQNNLDEAIAKARAEGKLLLVTFTGDSCTNCHWMKANMFTRPEIASAVKDLILVELYTDRSNPESERYQKLQETKFKTVAIPFYAIMDANQNVIASFPGSTRNSSEFLAFLNSGNTAPKTAHAQTIYLANALDLTRSGPAADSRLFAGPR
jgi:thiol:disulfide interchange protein